MAIDLSRLRRVVADQPPRILIYGPPKIGKTTLAAEFPNPVFIQVEDGTPGNLELTSFGHLKTFVEVMEALSSLLNEAHDFATVVIDSVDKLEPLVWAQTCEDNKWANIEAPGYGKGYLAAEHVWREFLALCLEVRHQRGMTVIHIAHSEIGRFDDPQTSSYSRYDIRLHKRALALFQDEMDAILFLNHDATTKAEDAGFNKKIIKGVGGGSRYIYAEPRPSFVAGTRYNVPDKILLKAGEGYKALAPYLPAVVPSETVNQAAE
jgi:Cdc6-like AAA superfamily ATPase